MSTKTSTEELDQWRAPLGRMFVFEEETRVQHFTITSNGVTQAKSSAERWGPKVGVSRDSTNNAEFHLVVGNGYGAKGEPMTITLSDLTDLCATWQFSPQLMKKCDRAFQELFEYHLEELPAVPDDATTPPTSTESTKILHVALRKADENGYFCLLRYDLNSPGTARCLIMTDSVDEIEEAVEILRKNAANILSSPTLVVSLLLANSCNQVCRSLHWYRDQAFALTSRLGVMGTDFRKFLTGQGFTVNPDRSYSALNVDIYALQYALTEGQMKNSALVVLVDSVRFVLESEVGEAHSSSAFQTVNDILRRCELNRVRIDFWLRISQNQSTVLYNMINQRDSRLNFSVARSSRQIAAASRRDSSAMKTISILTLVFLPGTFISAIFSTTIFDFSGPDVGYGTVGKAWWIYMLCCLLLTLLTVGVWAAWMTWRMNKAAAEEKKDEQELQFDDDFDALRYRQDTPVVQSRTSLDRISVHSAEPVRKTSHEKIPSVTRQGTQISLGGNAPVRVKTT